jgi:2-polyprenyl-3-methyl-5-hydroxy-6-metoxy-1,4-benzoquinol methylase/ribosomal protein S27E
MSAKPLRETDIRPDHLIAEQMARVQRDIDRLLEYQAQFVQVDCPACMAHERKGMYSKNGFQYVACLACETVYISPRPPKPILEGYYETSENYQYWSTHIFPASEDMRREHIIRPRADKVIEICGKYSEQPGILLEVGAGFGTFCEEISQRHYFEKIIAVEPTPPLAQRCKERGLNVINLPIEAVNFQDLQVDVVVSFEVIEHLFEPIEFIRSAAQLLKPGGILILTCPNVLGFDVQVLGTASTTVDFEHLNYFHPKSLAHLVGRAGFETLEVSTPGKLDAELVRKATLAGDFNLDSQPFLKQLLIDRWENAGDAFQQFLVEQGLSSHMWLVARKKMDV